MSMEISSNYKDYKNEYLDRVQTGQDKVKEASQDQRGEDKNEGIPVPKDEYISSEKSGSKPSGLYRLGQDENGNPKVIFAISTFNTDYVLIKSKNFSKAIELLSKTGYRVAE